MKNVLSSLLLAGSILFLAGCYTNPVTGRKSLVLLSPGDEAIETHFAWVFLLGDRALKLRKPVRRDTMDSPKKARPSATP